MDSIELANISELRLNGPDDNWMIWEPVTSGLPRGLADIVDWLSARGDCPLSLGDIYRHFAGSDWLQYVVLAVETEDNYQIVRYPEIATSVSGLPRTQGICLTDVYPAAWRGDILAVIRAASSTVACWKVRRRIHGPDRMLETEFWRFSFPFGSTKEGFKNLAIILYPANEEARKSVVKHLKDKREPIPDTLAEKGMLGEE